MLTCLCNEQKKMALSMAERLEEYFELMFPKKSQLGTLWSNH
jgi:hypothetical protein